MTSKEEEPNRVLLIGYLEEALPAEQMTRIEELLRGSARWREALVEVRDQVDDGDHSVATIWRRHRLSCPTRERLGTYRLGILPPEEGEYVRFHLEEVQCRWCLANLHDLDSIESSGVVETPQTGRRRRFFQSSVGHLPGRPPK